MLNMCTGDHTGKRQENRVVLLKDDCEGLMIKYEAISSDG